MQFFLFIQIFSIYKFFLGNYYHLHIFPFTLFTNVKFFHLHYFPWKYFPFPRTLWTWKLSQSFQLTLFSLETIIITSKIFQQIKNLMWNNSQAKNYGTGKILHFLQYFPRYIFFLCEIIHKRKYSDFQLLLILVIFSR